MIHTVMTLETDGGVLLPTESWLPESAPLGLVVVVHGITEHFGRYQHLAEAFTSAGLGFCGYDLRGHGRSSGPRGHLQRWTQLVDDLDRYVRELRTRHPGVPLFVFGHSLGSLIVLAHTVERTQPIRGMILSGTAVEPVGVASPFRVFLARSFSAIWPKLRIRIPRRATATLSRIREVEEEFWSDPLRLRGVTARFGSEALDLIEFVKQRAAAVTVPLLMLHGGSDPLNSLAGARRFFEQTASLYKEFIIYPGGLHEPLNDQDRDQVLADILAWILDHLPSRSPECR